MHEKDVWLLAFALAFSAVCVVCWLQWRLAHFALCFVWRDTDLRSSYAWWLALAALVVVTAGLGTMCGTVIATLPFWLGTLAAFGELRDIDTAAQNLAQQRLDAECRIANALGSKAVSRHEPAQGEVERDRFGRVRRDSMSRRIYPFVVIPHAPAQKPQPEPPTKREEPTRAVAATQPAEKQPSPCRAKTSAIRADKKKLN